MHTWMHYHFRSRNAKQGLFCTIELVIRERQCLWWSFHGKSAIGRGDQRWKRQKVYVCSQSESARVTKQLALVTCSNKVNCSAQPNLAKQRGREKSTKMSRGCCRPWTVWMDGCNSLCWNERKKLLRLQCFIILSRERKRAAVYPAHISRRPLSLRFALNYSAARSWVQSTALWRGAENLITHTVEF